MTGERDPFDYDIAPDIISVHSQDSAIVLVDDYREGAEGSEDGPGRMQDHSGHYMEPAPHQEIQQMDFAHGNIPGAAADNNTGTMSSGYHTGPAHAAVPCEDDVHSNDVRSFDTEERTMPQSDQMPEMPAGADGRQPHLQPVCPTQSQLQQRQQPGENQPERPTDDQCHVVNPVQSQSLHYDEEWSLRPYLLEQRRQHDFYKAHSDSAACGQSNSQYRMLNAPHQPHHTDRSQGDKQSHHHPHPGQARQHHQQFHVLDRVMTDSEKSPLDPSLRSSSIDIEMLPLGHSSSEIQEVLPQGLNFCQPSHQFVCLQQRRFYQQQQDREYRRDGAKEEKFESHFLTPGQSQNLHYDEELSLRQYLLEQCRQRDFCNALSDSSLCGQAETLYNRVSNSQCSTNVPHQPHRADRLQGHKQSHHHSQPSQARQHYHQQFHMPERAMTDSKRSPSDPSLGFSSTDIEMGPLRHSSGDRQEESPQDFPLQRLQDERRETQTVFHDTQNPDLEEYMNPGLTDAQDNESFFLENNSNPHKSYNHLSYTLHAPEDCQVIITSNIGSSTEHLNSHGILSHPAFPMRPDDVDEYNETMRVGQGSPIAGEQSHEQRMPITEPSIEEYHRSPGLDSSSVTSDKSSYNDGSRCLSSDDDTESLSDIERLSHNEATRPFMDEHQLSKSCTNRSISDTSTSSKKMPQQCAQQTCCLGKNSLNIQGLNSVESHQQGHKQHPWQKVGDIFKKILQRKRSKGEAYSKVKQNKGKRKVDAASTASPSVSGMARKCPNIEVVVACDRDSSVPFPVVERRVNPSISGFGSRPRKRTNPYQDSSKPVRIFITYALSQREYARQLAGILRKNNFEVNLDLTKDCYQEEEFDKFSQDKYGWRSSIYSSSSYIIVLCSRDYCQEAQCKEYELEATCLSTSWFYCQMETDFHLRRGRFIPVLSPGCDTSCVPSFLKTCILDWPCDMDKEDRLLRRLTNRSTAPKLGAPLPIVEITFNIRRVKDSDISCTSANDDARSFLI